MHRRRFLALSGVTLPTVVAGCLGDGEEPDSNTPTRTETSTQTPGETPTDSEPEERPDWVDDDGDVDIDALANAHHDAVSEHGVHFMDEVERVDFDESLGAFEFPPGTVEIEMRDRHGPLWLRAEQPDGDWTELYRFEFADVQRWGPDAEQVRLSHTPITVFPFLTIHESPMWARLAGSQQYTFAADDQELEYLKATEHEGETAHRIEGNTVTGLVGDDGGIRELEGTATVYEYDPDAESEEEPTIERTVAFEFSAEFGVDPRDPPAWTDQTPWLDGDEAVENVYEIEHRGGATIDAGTQLRVRGSVESDQIEKRMTFDEPFEPGETRLFAFEKTDEGVELRLFGPEADDPEGLPIAPAESGRPPILDVEADAYYVTIKARERNLI